jgi:alkanesulfonate monooxygenase SsuD/methylene tetrahydromethanopterin reductase-like flavin-dependent oxidoreductase (luciferase family)
MQLGLTIWGFDAPVGATVDVAVEAERRNFHSVFLVEGVFSNDGITTVAGIAGRTSRIVVGTGIANVFLRHPVMLGLSATAIDEISGGRFVLGLGPNNQGMVSRAGLPWRDPREALRETTETVRAVCAGTGMPGLRTPLAATRAIPIHWAAMALETAEAAGAHADGLMLYLCAPQRYAIAVDRMRRGAAAAGRDPNDVRVSVLIPTFLDDDVATARHAAREFLVHYAGMPHYAKTFASSGFAQDMDLVGKALASGDRAAAMAALSDALLDATTLVGPASRCREHLAERARAGVDWVLIGPQRVGDQSLVQEAARVVRELAPAS